MGAVNAPFLIVIFYILITLFSLAIKHYGWAAEGESGINCLLLSLHLGIRNNDRINLDYRLL